MAAAALWQHKPIVSVITSFLTPIEDICLHRALVLRRHVPLISMLLARLERILARDYALNAGIITVIMLYVRSGCAWLTGGALLALLRGEAIRAESDFDFVFPNNGSLTTVKTFCTALVTVGKPNHTVHGTAYIESGSDDGRGYEWIPYCHQVYKLYIGRADHGWRRADFKVDLIVHDDINCYLQSFDMAFCANVLSGKGLIIRNADAVVRGQCVVNAERYLAHPATSFDALSALASNAKIRINKYRQRGFRVDIDVCFDRTLRFLQLKGSDLGYQGLYVHYAKQGLYNLEPACCSNFEMCPCDHHATKRRKAERANTAEAHDRFARYWIAWWRNNFTK
jgi:hypothetical protein